MRITPISMAANYAKKSVKFGEKENGLKPLIKIDEDTPDDKIVSYGTWGSNYVYPITAGQIRNIEADKQKDCNETGKESTEEYYKRKLYSTEWTM